MNMNLYIVSLDLINGYNPFILDIFSLLSVLSAILVITTKNPIVSVLFLISLFLVISVNLIMVGMHFIGLSYLLVYVGAISILFLFVLMLINIRISELTSYTNNSIPLALIFSMVLYFAVEGVFVNSSQLSPVDIDLATSTKWDGLLTSSSHISSIGNIIYTSYAPWLILVAMILLLAMVGAIAITIKTPEEDDILTEWEEKDLSATTKRSRVLVTNCIPTTEYTKKGM